MSVVAGREIFECPHCWLVFYSQSALTRHINQEHWQEKELDDDSV